jgi:hypothetical protein
MCQSVSTLLPVERVACEVQNETIGKSIQFEQRLHLNQTAAVMQAHF